MEYTKELNGNICKIKMMGKFTFADHMEFKNILSDINEKEITGVDLDISEVEFVDSAALGLLLLIRDETEKKSLTLTLFKPQGQVQKMFKISRFYELFHVVESKE